MKLKQETEMDNKVQQKEKDGNGMFYIEKDGNIVAELTYKILDNGVLTINHTETSPEMEGKGMASKLVEHSVEYARENDIKIDPLCAYAAKQFERHEEYREVQVQ